MTRLLVVMGSAETTPTMIKPHRRIFEAVGDAPAVMLDTPYGFQENADDTSARAQEYFTRSVGRQVDVASYRTADIDPLAAETARTRVREAGWVFAGPGSPTYVLRTWRGSGITELLLDKLHHGGAVVFSSAAALTVGAATVPVYEIYKAGEAPRWEEGLDLLSVIGLRAAVIPHYDNAEGGHHDTRYCYLGERRLSLMEAQLADDACVLGVDEHSVVVFDLEAGSLDVAGLGGLTIRRHGASTVFRAGTTLSFDDVRAAALGTLTSRTTRTTGGPTPAPAAGPAPGAVADAGSGSGRTPLLDEARRLDAVFSAALAERDVQGAVRATLELEETLAHSGIFTGSVLLKATEKPTPGNYTADNLPALFQIYQARWPEKFAQIFGNQNLPMKGKILDPRWVCERTREGYLNCDPEFHAAFDRSLHDPALQKGQLELAWRGYNERVKRFKTLGLKSEYGIVFLAVRHK
jgi:cyanophycinase-like exopeptidase